MSIRMGQMEFGCSYPFFVMLNFPGTHMFPVKLYSGVNVSLRNARFSGRPLHFYEDMRALNASNFLNLSFKYVVMTAF
jgi:hypothetical protein